jgi:hypothetical protein
MNTIEIIESNKQIVELVTCSICNEILKSPLVSHCQHRFCSVCITQWLNKKSSCPICRNYLSITMMTNDILSVNIINKLAVKCCLSDKEGNACNHTTTYENINNHYKSDCKYAKVDCKYACGYSNFKEERIYHENNKCFKNPELKGKCKHCDEIIYVIKIKEHKLVCPNLLIKCESHGCNFEVKRCEMEQHMKLFKDKHMEQLKKLYEDTVKEFENFKKVNKTYIITGKKCQYHFAKCRKCHASEVYSDAIDEE